MSELQKRLPDCGHHWTVTSACPRCLRDALDAQAQEIARLDRDLDEAMRERDDANNAITATHIALGGDGEWVSRSWPQEPPDSGDLSADVPALAEEVRAERDALRARLAEADVLLSEIMEFVDFAGTDSYYRAEKNNLWGKAALFLAAARGGV